VDTSGCLEVDGRRLLYVGISPKPPPANGTPASRQQLRSRLHQHYRGNAAGSTLRLTLGCLLAPRLGLQLRRVGSGGRLTFAEGEQVLSGWMGSHTGVCWIAHSRPWELEQALVAQLDLPLNLHGNAQHPCYQQLRAVRAATRATARAPPGLVTAAATPDPCLRAASRETRHATAVVGRRCDGKLTDGRWNPDGQCWASILGGHVERVGRRRWEEARPSFRALGTASLRWTPRHLLTPIFAP